MYLNNTGTDVRKRTSSIAMLHPVSLSQARHITKLQHRSEKDVMHYVQKAKGACHEGHRDETHVLQTAR